MGRKYVVTVDENPAVVMIYIYADHDPEHKEKPLNDQEEKAFENWAWVLFREKPTVLVQNWLEALEGAGSGI